MNNKDSPCLDVKIKFIPEGEKGTINEAGLSGIEIIKVDGLDISVSGIGVVSEEYISENTIGEIEIDGTVFNLSEPMFIKADVCSCARVDSLKYRWGMKFMDIDSRYQEAIRGFVLEYERRRERRMNLG